MPQRLFESLIFRVGMAMAAITMLAIASMIGSVLIADTARGDAAAINLAGSLRMQSYRLATTLQAEPDPAMVAELDQRIGAFEQSLRAQDIVGFIPEADSDALRQVYLSVERRWQEEMLPALQLAATDPGAGRQAYLGAVADFVDEIDSMVTLIQGQAEARVHMLRLGQGIALFLTVGVVFFAMYKLLTDVMPPLKDLLEVFGRARRGDLSGRASYAGADELGLLSHTYNLMAEDLSRMYADLERRVEEKTDELGQETTSSHDYRKLLARLEEVTGLQPLTLCLTTENAERAYRRIATVESGCPDFCHAPHCTPCLRPDEERPIYMPHSGLLSVPVQESGRQYGAVLVRKPAISRIAPWQRELIETVAGHIATGLSLAQQRDERHRLALMEERAVIARELHDSLAQSLSYLKIQLARLQSLLRQDSEREALDEVASELRGGLNSAYRQLRELLSTFRLKVDAPGLEPALQQTVEEFSRRGELGLLLDYRLEHCPLTPNEEVHTLQIVREAMANVIHHAKASQAELHLETTGEGNVLVTILDNGIGIPENWQKSQHYGLTIMQERAQSLGGRLDFARRPEGGTCVSLVFTPQFATGHDHSKLVSA